MEADVKTSMAAPFKDSIAKRGGSYQLQSLDRAVAVLESLSEGNTALSLTEICRRMNLPKSTVHRLLMVLEQSALIERSPENRFRLGLKLLELGNHAVEQIDLRARIRPFFQRLASQTGETVHLSVLQETSVVYLDKLEPYRPVCMTSKMGSANPVYCTSMGKALLAFQPLETAELIISKIRFVRYTHQTLSSKEALLKSLKAVRQLGYAIDDQEIEVGIRCIGAPIFDEKNRAVAAVSVSGPSSRITSQSMPEIVRALLRCSREMSLFLQTHSGKRSRVPTESEPRINA